MDSAELFASGFGKFELNILTLSLLTLQIMGMLIFICQKYL